MHRRAALGALAAWACAAPGRADAAAADEPPPGRALRVGPGEPLQTVAEAAMQARDGDIVEVAAGDYRGDVAVWPQARLSLRAVGGVARLLADGASAEGKAIWVLRDGDFDIEGFEFAGVSVPHRNGAGIRFEGGRLSLRGCRFLDSECGILTGGGGRLRTARLLIEGCEFGHLGDGEGQAHGIYAGEIGLLQVSGSYFHHGRVGHLIKSRARVNDIRYNRITDEEDGRASYEIDLPNGGLAVLVGNLLQQGPLTENWHMVSFGHEGYRPGRNRLFVASNTFVNDRPRGGVFVRAVPGADDVTLANNVWCGAGALQVGAGASQRNNASVMPPSLRDARRFDYRLVDQAGAWRYEVPQPSEVDGLGLVPVAEYRHPVGRHELTDPPSRPGALQSRPGTPR